MECRIPRSEFQNHHLDDGGYSENYSGNRSGSAYGTRRAARVRYDSRNYDDDDYDIYADRSDRYYDSREYGSRRGRRDTYDRRSGSGSGRYRTGEYCKSIALALF